MQDLGLLGSALHVGVSSDPQTQRELGIELDPDPQVAVRVERGPEREHAVDDQYSVTGHIDDNRRMVELRERIDAAQRDAAGAVEGCRIEQQPAHRLEVECVALVTLAGHAVIEVRVAPGALEVIK